MKNLLYLFLLLPLQSIAQQGFACPDTVCANDSVNYWVQNTQGSTYNWTLSGGGTLINSPSNQVAVNWGQANGTYTLTVTETNADGCVGQPVTCTIEILQPVVQIPPVQNICEGSQPFQLIASPQGGSWVVNGNATNGIFNPNQSGTYTAVYTYVNSAGCIATGQTTFTVYPLPNTSPINHN